MKFEEKEVKRPATEGMRKDLNNVGEMKAGTDNPADVFQAQLYNSGRNLLAQLDKIEGTGANADKSYEELVEQLQQLRDFHFNIGFAGGMSSGKSTVINSLIEYPLMPTCKLTTTCVGTHIFYGEKPRISVVDDDTGKQVLNVDCTNISKVHFQKLKEYACTTTHFKIIENLQHFTTHNIFQDKDALEPGMLNMDQNDPNQVIILLMILLTVYVDQNSQEKSPKALAANKKRKEVLDFFNFPSETVNYTIQLQWNGDFLKSGMTITDLPGLGAYAPDKDMGEGKLLKGHDSISTDAITKTDAMVFLVDPQVDGSGVPALEVMMSNAKMKEVVNQSDLVIPVLNKVDDCNGQSEVDQAIEKFVDILKNTGINKDNKDIHLYSAWFGEHKFRDFPIERTCFYFRNADMTKSMLKTLPMFKNMPEAQLTEMVKENIRAQLEESYNKAGIDDLKLFFRSAYISKSKNRRSQAAILTMRELAAHIITPMEELLNNYDILRGVAGNAIDDISKGLKNSVDDPISQALAKIANVDHDNTYITEKLEDIPGAYVAAFKDALDEYKKRNRGICSNFSLGWLGFSDNARIDQLGSTNQRNYVKLCEEMKTLGIDVKAVNKKFTSVLQHVTKETEAMYSGALQVLLELKNSITDSMNAFVKEYEQTAEGDAAVMQSVKALKEALVKYMEQQINVIVDSMKVNQSNLAKAGNQTVNEILALNKRMVNMYTKSVVDEVKTALSNGMFYSSREYIKVTGTGGVMETFADLSLSSADQEYIENEVKTIGIVAISNNLDSWYQDTENIINMNFTALRQQLRNMMDDTVAELSGNADDIEADRKALEEKLEAVKKAFTQIRSDVQQHYDDSLASIDDATLNKYRENIFFEILTNEDGNTDEESNHGLSVESQ